MAIKVSRAGSNQFSRRVRLRAEKFERGAGRVVKTAARAALEYAVFNTRIDTSKLVSNWQVSIDGAGRGVLEAHFQGKAGSTGGSSIATSLALGYAEIERFKITQNRDLYLTNNTPYFRYVDDGQTSDAMRAAQVSIAGARLL